MTSAILNALVAEDLPGPGTVFLQVNWSFKAPVRPGDTITGFAEVIDVRADKPIAKLRTRVTRGDGTVVLEGDVACYTLPLGRAYLALDRVAAAAFLNNARSIASAIALYPASPGCRWSPESYAGRNRAGWLGSRVAWSKSMTPS